jgi:hypothetical protein
LKVNYRFERNQRARAKAIKKQEKLQRRDEAAAKRKALQENPIAIDPAAGVRPSEGTGTPESK